MFSFIQTSPALLILFFTGCAGAFQVLSTPHDAAGRHGDGSMLFNCSSVLSTDLSEVARWTFQSVGSTSERTLYSGTTSTAMLAEEKYTVDDYHSLTGHNLTFDMAGTYTCKVLNIYNPTDDVQYTVYGLVLDKLQCPSSRTYSAGETVTVGCAVKMAGLLNPDIVMMLNGSKLDATQISSLDMTSASGSDVVYEYKFNVSEEDDGAAFTCSLAFSTSSSNMPPSYTDSCLTVIRVEQTYGVQDVEVSLSSLDNSTVEVGDVINCTARGNPEPEIVWRKISGNATETEVIGTQLLVTKAMVGRNQYECTAKNTADGMDYMENVMVNFTAEGARPYGVRDLSVSLDTLVTSTLEVGDIINCTARGNPEPEITWHKVTGSATEAEVAGSQLTVTSAMIGRNEYRCRAKNTVNGMESVKTVTVKFTAEGAVSSGATYALSWVLLVVVTMSNLV